MTAAAGDPVFRFAPRGSWEQTPDHRPGDPARYQDQVGVMAEDGRLVLEGRMWISLSNAFQAGPGLLVYANTLRRAFTVAPGTQPGSWDLVGTLVMAVKDAGVAMVDVGKFYDDAGVEMPPPRIGVAVMDFEWTEGTSNRGENR